MSLFSDMMGELSQSKNVGSLIVGQPFLAEGSHDVRITSVDTADIDNPQGPTIRVTFENDKGHAHNAMIFLQGENKRTGAKEVGYGFRLLLSGLFPDLAAILKFAMAAEQDQKIVEAFTGMRLNITLELGKGIVAKALPAAEGELPKYAGYLADEKLTPEFGTVKEVYDLVKADPVTYGKRAYMQITAAKATHKSENIAAFELAVENAAKLKALKPKQAKASF